MSVAFPYVDTGQVSYNECPQFLVCCHLTRIKRETLTTLSHLIDTQPKVLFPELFTFETCRMTVLTKWLTVLETWNVQETIYTNLLVYYWQHNFWKWQMATVMTRNSPVEQQWTEPQRYPCSSLRCSRGPDTVEEETHVNGSYYLGQMLLVNCG